MGGFKRRASKHVYYLGWNRSPAQVGCMRQVLGPGAPGRPRGIGWRGRWEGDSGWGIHVNPWLIHVSVWQKPLQYCKVISLQLIKINEKKNKNKKKTEPRGIQADRSEAKVSRRNCRHACVWEAVTVITWNKYDLIMCYIHDGIIWNKIIFSYDNGYFQEYRNWWCMWWFKP